MIRYTRQQYTSAELIARLAEMAKKVVDNARRGEKFDPPLIWRELAFYDAVAEHGTAQEHMGDEILAAIARDLVAEARKRPKPDWIAREPVRASLGSAIKRLLARRGYPPDRRAEAVGLVLKQVEHFADEWSTIGVPDSWHRPDTMTQGPCSLVLSGSAPRSPVIGRSRPARRSRC
ncbi:hypothetical protein HY68_08880 [Streptomyces sp. AcH 505]|uniref:type I restriction enzyme endonuclease domain-containing protein n=1 Tax=Streptomyces sp. AcH 505 TaxID=352211 RepID=UPI00059192C6|nr:hypothetical protein HY68_08880 [Streptomyces sp. AcH 505]